MVTTKAYIEKVNGCWKWLSESNEIAARVSIEEVAFLKHAFLTVDHRKRSIFRSTVPPAAYDALAVAGNGPCIHYLSSDKHGFRLWSGFQLALFTGNLHAVQSLFHACANKKEFARFPLPSVKIHWDKVLATEERLEELMPPVLDWCISRMQPSWTMDPLRFSPSPSIMSLPPRTYSRLLQAITGVSN